MSRELFLNFEPEGIGSLPYGPIDIGVPLHNNRIQIGGNRRASDARLLVVTDDEFIIAISRLDGASLQADIVDADKRHPVFQEPIDKLLLIPDMGNTCDETIWFARADSGNIKVTAESRLQQFAHTVGYYAYCKAYDISPVRV